MSVKGGIKKIYKFLSVKWGSTEPTNTEIDTTTGGDKTVTVKAGTDMASLTSYEVTNGQDLTAGSTPATQNAKFIQVIPTLRSTESGVSPTLNNLVVNSVETLSSFLSNPKSHKIILAEMLVGEEITGWDNIGGRLLKGDGSYVLDGDGDKIIIT